MTTRSAPPMKHYGKVARSQANRDLNAIVRALEDLRTDMLNWLEEHPVGCLCDHCGARTGEHTIEHIHEDLKGLSWALLVGAGMLGSITVPAPEEVDEMLAQVGGPVSDAERIEFLEAERRRIDEQLAELSDAPHVVTR
jgi:hypothetical protein